MIPHRGLLGRQKRNATFAVVLVTGPLAAACGGNSPPPRAAIDSSTERVVAASTTASESNAAADTTAANTTAASEVPSYVGIRSITLEIEPGSCIKRVGTDQFQFTRKKCGGGDFSFGVDWKSRGENGDVESDRCAVILNAVGPGNTDERRRSAQCSGGTDRSITPADIPGRYTVSISVTPPDGGMPITASKTFELIAYGS